MDSRPNYRALALRPTRQIVVKPTLFERTLAMFSPRLASRRIGARANFEVLTRGYEGATTSRRAGGWVSRDTSANAEILPVLHRLRARSRDLARNNAYAAKAVREIDLNSVGAGILPRFSHASERAVAWAKALWRQWAETTQCDSDGVHDFYGLQGLVARTFAESGEVLVRRRVRRMTDGLAVPLQLQVLEPDFMDTSKDGVTANGNQLIQGIEFDAIGRRVAYWLHRTHPGDAWAFRKGNSVRVPAEEIYHVFEQERPGQARGVPRAASVILRLRNFDEYEDAQLQKQIIAACFAGYVYDQTGAGAGALTPSNKTASGLEIDAIESGMIETLPAGKDIKFSDPPKVEGYADYASVVLHAVAAGFGVPYALLTGNYSQFNYSSGRMAWLAFSRQVDVWRWRMLIPKFCQRAADDFFQTALDAGLLTSAPAVAWRPPRREMVSPKEEIPAIRSSVRSGLVSPQQAIMEVSGEDPEDVLAEFEDWNQKVDKAGIVLDIDPRKISLAGTEQPSISVEAHK